jgi:hypothetical protein
MAPPAAAPAPEAPAPVATAPALPTFKDDAGYTFTKAADGTITVTGAPEGKKLPAKTEFKPTDAVYEKVSAAIKPVEAPKPAAPTSDFYRMPDGSVFESLEGKGVRQVAPKRGDLTFDKEWKAEGSAAYTAATSRLEGEDVRELSKDEAMKFQFADLGAGLEAKKPDVEAREVRGSTVIDGGRVRNVGTDIRDTLDRMRKRREERKAERGVSPAVEGKEAAGKFSQTEFTKPLPSGDDIKDVERKGKGRPGSVGEFYAGFGALRDERLMQGLKNIKAGEDDYDLAERYAAAQSKTGEDYYKEVAGIAADARKRATFGKREPKSVAAPVPEAAELTKPPTVDDFEIPAATFSMSDEGATTPRPRASLPIVDDALKRVRRREAGVAPPERASPTFRKEKAEAEAEGKPPLPLATFNRLRKGAFPMQSQRPTEVK